ncbi:MAG: metallophosphoesterase [Bacteroidetes bacterium]|jgi:predicted phosphodiesterase|nr:metallophosphoesterase [Bacteroidota bacterium]MBT6685295.1 metallophosphoesterase [Bacteroidota bacterium]MBT7141742.1 metallophosphoesterase [Bacteroidota bacterium]MBT7491440.1 metallophosphoesterase [Bacteroidota bacterium]
MKLGIISDIHEDYISLLKAMEILNSRQVDEIICLGDIVGFSVPFYEYQNTRNANECIAIVKANCQISVIGNHDLYAIRKTPKKAGDFNFPENWFELDYDKRHEISDFQLWLYEENELSAMLNQSSKQYLLSLKESEISNYGGLKIFFTHYLSPDITGSTKSYITKSSDFEEHIELSKKNNCKYGFIGHAHMDGCLLASRKKYSLKTFGKFKVKNQLQTIVSPCIARGKHHNGFLIFDTKTFEIEAVSLQSKWEIIKNMKLIG